MEIKIKKYIKKISIFITLLIVLLILLIVICPYKYNEIVDMKHLGFSIKHFFGTDYLGRDFFVRICFASLITILISIFSVVCSVFIGGIYGIFAGYKGKNIQKIMIMFLNILESVPDFLLAIIMLLIFNNINKSGSIMGIFITLILVSWTQMARMIISEVNKIKDNEYIQYAKIKKASFFHMLSFHFIPDLKNDLIVISIQKIPSAIFLESFLSFIGIGIQPPLPSLGRMISEGIKNFRLYFRELLIPCIMLILIVLLFNVIGEKMMKLNTGDNDEK